MLMAKDFLRWCRYETWRYNASGVVVVLSCEIEGFADFKKAGDRFLFMNL